MKKQIFCVKPLEIFLSKSKVCGMTLMSKALDKSVFDGITFLLKINEESGKHRYVYFGGVMIDSSLTDGTI